MAMTEVMWLEEPTVQQALDILKKDTITLHHSETLSATTLSRRATLQRIVNRFYWQIRYGCQNPGCRVPTCLSCRRRVAKHPLRPFTVLSAKALAAFLAEQDNPEQSLCPHAPADVQTLSREKSQSQQAPSHDDALHPNPEHENPQSHQASSAANHAHPRIAEKKDFKSISQSLFDTSAWWVFQSISHQGDRFVWTKLPQAWEDGDEERNIDRPGDSASIPKVFESSASGGTSRGDKDRDALQALSHFTPSNIRALVKIIKALDPGLKEQHDYIRAMETTERPLYRTAFSQQTRLWYRYAYQSMVHIFSHVDSLSQSFLGPSKIGEEGRSKEALVSLDYAQIEDCIRHLKNIEGVSQRILASLWIALGQMFVPHSELKSRRYRHQEPRSHATSSIGPNTLEQAEAVHVIGIALAALNAHVPVRGVSQNDFFSFRYWSSYGHPGSNEKLDYHHRPYRKGAFIPLQDAFEDDHAMDLATRVVRVFMSHRALEKLNQQGIRPQDGLACTESSNGFTSALVSFIESYSVSHVEALPNHPRGLERFIHGDERNLQKLLLIEWLRRVIFRHWNGKAEIERASPVVGAIEWLSVLHHDRRKLGLLETDFRIRRLYDKLDPIETPVAWESSAATNTVNILSFPFLLLRSDRIAYFRAINHASMRRIADESLTAARMMVNMAGTFPGPDRRLLERMKPVISNFLVLDIRRDNILTDALNQLWRRNRRELKKPLKVQLGMEEGEQGVDQGGIQQEFFRLVMAEAFDPGYGLFTTDPTTKMSWFQPGALEPLYKYELLGLLASLAVYNGLTLPFTFPKVLYMKLLDLPLDSIWDANINDGWPELANGLRQLWDWEGDDVEEVFMRAFTFEAPAPGGRTFSMDLSALCEDDVHHRHAHDSQREASSPTPNHVLRSKGDTRPAPAVPSTDESGKDGVKALSPNAAVPPPPPPPRMVTSLNRRAYVQAYVQALTTLSIAPQFDAFRTGFLTVLSPQSLSLFAAEPADLQQLVEGLPASHTTAAELRAHCKYENGFEADSATVGYFWDVVEHEYDTAMLGTLLEFVTSSARVAVQGVESMAFVVVRNGDDEARLPTSMTCFGRLLLPEYRSKEVLRERFRVALEHSRGFGVA